MYKQENFERNLDILAFFFFFYWLHYKVMSQIHNTPKKNQSLTEINLQKGFTVVQRVHGDKLSMLFFFHCHTYHCPQSNSWVADWHSKKVLSSGPRNQERDNLELWIEKKLREMGTMKEIPLICMSQYKQWT